MTSIGRARGAATLLLVGAASRDIDRRDPRGWRLGGGVTYGALSAARLGLAVRALVGVDAESAAAAELELLADAGVELELVRLRRGPVMENRETPRGRVQIVGQPSARIPVAALPKTWAASPAVLLAPIADELPPAWARTFPAQTFVALAWQGLLRRLVAGQPMIHLPLGRRALIDRADIGLVSADDPAPGGVSIASLLRRDGQQLVVTHGERGALHLRRRGGGLDGRLLPIAAADRVRDSTGAGDIFLATWCSALVAAPHLGRSEDDWRALAVAAAAAGLSVEVSGLAELPALEAICHRLLRLRPAAAR